VSSTAVTEDERDFYERIQPAGLTLFARNIPDQISETRILTDSLQATRPAGAPPMIIAIDQEGGRVRRIKKDFPERGPALNLEDGRTDMESLNVIGIYAKEIGTKLLSLGVNVNFAPVVDILTEPANLAIGDRAFGTDVGPVCSRSRAFLNGLQASGVLGCLKHFPGQGDAKVDTHIGKAIVDLPRKVLDERELVPFRALLSKAKMVMISHCIYPQLSPEEAGRSPKIIGALLRGEMGFEGVVVSDDMGMGAMPQEEKEWQDAIVESVAAGVDMVLVCEKLERFHLAYEALVAAAARSRSFQTRLADAAARVTELRRGLK
jgi:beta-N-acetylhexosaminidase